MLRRHVKTYGGTTMARITQADLEVIGKAVPDPTPTEMALMAILRD